MWCSSDNYAAKPNSLQCYIIICHYVFIHNNKIIYVYGRISSEKDCSFIYALCNIQFSNTLNGKMTFSRLFNWIIIFPYILIVFCRQQNMLYLNVLMRKIIRMVVVLSVKLSLSTQAIINVIFEAFCGVRVDHHFSFLYCVICFVCLRYVRYALCFLCPFMIVPSGNYYLLLYRIKIGGLEILIIVIMLPIVYQTTKKNW